MFPPFISRSLYSRLAPPAPPKPTKSFVFIVFSGDKMIWRSLSSLLQIYSRKQQCFVRLQQIDKVKTVTLEIPLISKLVGQLASLVCLLPLPKLEVELGGSVV
eukprot:TRINITY_DN22042_c0_g1_i1.p1 TRINITY_DN22042_c0_g1~~TRINITY_DN22042_c0_g1_i1.p1  ORF type:complete len:103 (+),score=4.22 TRINITY_DN22042_c0_g1_i1:130-438(+)